MTRYSIFTHIAKKERMPVAIEFGIKDFPMFRKTVMKVVVRLPRWVPL